MWTYATYCWADEAAYLSALAAAGLADGTTADVSLLPVGTVYAPPADEETPGEPLAGYYVAAAFRGRPAPAVWSDAEVDHPPGMPVLGRNPVPQSVSRFQARAALHNAGLLPAVEAAIAASGDALAQIAWADAASFERSSPTVAAIAAGLGVTDSQIDDLFRAAAKIIA